MPLEAFGYQVLCLCTEIWTTLDLDPFGGSEDNYTFAIRRPGGDSVDPRVPWSITTYSPELVRDWILVQTQLSSKE